MADDKTKDGNGTENADQNKGNENKAPDNTGNASDKGEKTVPYSRFQEVVGKRKEAETTVQEVLDEMVETIPEDKRDLIPDLPPAAKIKWLRKATAAGIFGGGEQQKSGPDSKRPGGTPSQDLDNMSPRAMRASGYKT